MSTKKRGQKTKKELELDTLIEKIYAELRDLLCSLHIFLGMNVETFEAQLAAEIPCSESTIHRSRLQKMSSAITYDRLFPALRRVILSPAALKVFELEQTDRLILKYKAIALIIKIMAIYYACIEFFTKSAKFYTDENEIAIMVGGPTFGFCPDDSRGLSKEEADVLLRYLNRKGLTLGCINPENIIATGNAMEEQLGEFIRSSEPIDELIQKRANEILNTYFCGR